MVSPRWFTGRRCGRRSPSSSAHRRGARRPCGAQRWSGARRRRKSERNAQAPVDRARKLIGEYKVRAAGPDAPIGTLSGGNMQRAVLARELSEQVSVLVAANPVFGLDFAAVAEIHGRILAARDAGAAVLLVSEDLDELLQLSDRILVMFDGRIVYETPAAGAAVNVIGRHMAGHVAAREDPD